MMDIRSCGGCRVGGGERNRRWASTGSKPPWLHGLQRSRRQPASTSPRSMPYRSIACDRVARAGRLVLAAARKRRRDHAAGRAGSGRSRPRAQRSVMPASARPRLGSTQLAAQLGAGTPVQTLALGQLARVRAAPTITTSCAVAAAWRLARSNASRSSRLTGCGRRRRRPCATPTGRGAARLAGSSPSPRERVQDEVPVAVRAALAVDALELGAARQAAALGPARRRTSGRQRPLARSDGESLAALGAAALERQPAGRVLHARAEPVRAGALALLGLVGPLHGGRAG